MIDAVRVEDVDTIDDRLVIEDSLYNNPLALSRSVKMQFVVSKSDTDNRSRFLNTPIRKYQPLNYMTCLSERQLNDHGLKTLSHQTDQWLVPIDADDLSEDDICREWHTALSARIAELREIADEEALAFDALSANRAMAFATQIQALVRPGAFLLANGNVRLVWQGRDGEQIGLQFLADGDIQYILFARRGDGLSQTLGNDRGDVVLRIITAVGLRHVLRP